MAATCGATFAKIVLIIFNFLFLCAGLVLIAVGIWMIADPSILRPLKLVGQAFNSTLLNSSAILLIAMGAFVVLVTVLGLVAAIKESVCLLGIYIGFLCIVCGGEIAGGVIAIAYKDAILQSIDSTLFNSLYGKYGKYSSGTYYTLSSDNSSCTSQGDAALWDFVQTKFQCCGLRSGYINSGYNYFNYSITSICPKLNTTLSNNVPITCCSYTGSSSSVDQYGDNLKQYDIMSQYTCSSVSSVGCADQITLFVQKYAPVLIGIGIGFGMLELFGIIFAVCLCQNPRK